LGHLTDWRHLEFKVNSIGHSKLRLKWLVAQEGSHRKL